MNRLYYADPYRFETEAVVVSVGTKGANTIVELDQTVAYPGGGGQANDTGEIVGQNGSLRFENAYSKDSETIVHHGKIFGRLDIGDAVHLKIKWSHRHHGMRLHTAGHAIHDVVTQLAPNSVPVRANHGANPHIEYSGFISPENARAIENLVNNAVIKDATVVMQESNLEEIQANCKHVPLGLPKDKPLRTVRIGQGQIVPCGGVHVAQLKEIGKVIITGIGPSKVAPANTIIKYRISSKLDD